MSLHPQLPDQIRELVAASKVPLDAGAIRRQLKGEFAVKAKQLPEFVAMLPSIEGLVSWPAANEKAGPRYWTRTPEQAAEPLAIETAAAAPVPAKKLITAITKGKAGYPKSSAEAFIARLEEEGKLHRQPLLAEAKYKLTSRLTDADRDYLRRALRVILRSLGSEVADIPQPVAAPPPADEKILDTLAALEPQKGLLVTASRLRRANEGIPKKDFDEAVMRLYRNERVLLHRHSGPHLLPEAERDELIRSGDTYYVGVCWNTGEN
jgi:hypothetical protein